MQRYDLDAANNKRESLGKKRLTREQADKILRSMQGNEPKRDGAAFMEAVINAK